MRAHVCTLQCRVAEDTDQDDRNEQERSPKDCRRNVKDDKSLSLPSSEEQEANRRFIAESGQLRRRLSDCRERESQLELQLVKTQGSLNAANKQLAELHCCCDNRRSSASVRGRRAEGPDTVRDRLREATRRLEETESSRCRLEERLSAALVELEDAAESRRRLADELAARDGELKDVRLRTGFRRHVELVRRLNAALRLNEDLREQLRAKNDGGGATFALCADGRLRQDVTTTAATERLAVTASRPRVGSRFSNQPVTPNPKTRVALPTPENPV